MRKKNQRGKNPRKKGKEFEVNIKDADVNMQDLKNSKFRNTDRGERRSNGNDPSWYNHYPELLRNVTGVNFGTPLGAQLDPGIPTAFTGGVTNSVAGVCTIEFLPTIGSCSASQVINNANKVAMQLYAAMRWKLGSTASYEANDIMMYIGAMDSAYNLYALGARIYGLIRMRSPFNYYYGERLLNLMGIDYDSFADNPADFRGFINEYAIFLSSLYVPSDFDVFKRHVWMITNMFTDSNTAKAQLYAYVLGGYYVYNGTPKEGGPGRLDFKSINTTPVSSGNGLTFTQWKNMCQECMAAIMGSTDFGQMSSDIGKAFENDVFQVSLIPEDYITPISYSKEVLSQLENCKLNGSLAVPNSTYTGAPNFSIQQNMSEQSVARIYQDAYFTASTYGVEKGASNQGLLNQFYNIRHLLNFHDSEITNDMVMVATRGVSGDYTSTAVTTIWDGNVISPRSYGTEVYTLARMANIKLATSLQNQYVQYSYLNWYTGNNRSENVLSLLDLWAQFDWAPMFYVYDNTGVTGVTPNPHHFGDMDMYGMVDNVQIKALNECAVLSEFYSSRFPQVQ